MKHLKYKSLTMRIWMTFNVVILIIICSLSLIYMMVYRKISEKSKIHDLTVSHEQLIKNNNYNEPIVGFDKISNLKGSKFFIYTIGTNNKIQMVDANNGMQAVDQNKMQKMFPPPQNNNVHIPPGFNEEAVKMWMAGFVNDNNVSDKHFSKSYQGNKYLFVVSSIKYGDSGNYYLVSYLPNIEDNNLLYMVIGIGLLFIVIGFFAAKIVANYISKPLKKLEEYTLKIAHKDWKEPIIINSEDEIGRLAKSMNHMKNELKRADEEEKMFLQSISHDLKTPVMVIMSHAAAIIDGVYIDSVEKTAQIIRDEAINLEKKIKQMLYLNTLDYVLENNEQNEDIELHELVLHIINRFEVVNSKIQWDLNMNKVMIKGNSDKIQVAIENIVDNGLRYAKERMAVSLKKEDSFAVLEIYNDGPNIPKQHIDHIFDNLYKDKTGNFGLGLAITKKIINFYKGEIKAVNKENGVSFVIKFKC
ncbi:MAG: HAMP domain-containing sensor histidine kinase [Bacillota bacterium]|nr:HAMP domain-containing sensor histidine kinase [Bacillota bacterium]